MKNKEPLSNEQRLQWFNQARFGMFIHWGLYSIRGRAEWVMHGEGLSPEEYAPLADHFRPARFDPDAWAALAKEAGMKYMVFTTRHHDGFALYDSKVTDFTSVKTAASRDFVAEYVRACRRAGLKVGFYYSLLDWRSPAYFLGAKKDPQGWERFVNYVHAQVRELCTNYGRIDLLWYDGYWLPWAPEAAGPNRTLLTDYWRAKKLDAMARQLQPQIIINNRAGIPADYDTPEQQVIPADPGRAWESCMTINGSWGYHAGDPNWKSTGQLIQNLVYCAAGGGNYLLNIGPRADGSVPTPSVQRLREIGAWMKVNGESIYHTERCPWGAWTAGPTTAKGSTVYVHAFRWCGEELRRTRINNRVKSAYLLATGQKVSVEQRGDLLFLRGLPEKAPDRHDTVIVLKVEGKLRSVSEPAPWEAGINEPVAD